MGWQNRASISSYVYNHVGMLGESHHALAKSLFLGGVTRRFPDLNFGFLEGGVAWAASLYADLVGHFEKRSGGDASPRPRPTSTGTSSPTSSPATAATGRAWRRSPRPIRAGRRAARRVRRRRHRARRGYPRPVRGAFYCGCEADDPMTVTAFNTKAEPVRRPLQRHVRLRHLALGRAGHGRRARRGVRDGRARAVHRRRPARLRVHHPRALLHARQPRLLRRHRGRGRRRRSTPQSAGGRHARSAHPWRRASSTAPARPTSSATSACATGASSRSPVHQRSDEEPAAVDADGLVLSPGFIDVHTHYDVQALWDPALTPSPLHGVTTVIGGNCGFSIAPLAPDPVDYVMHMMARGRGHADRLAGSRSGVGLGVLRRVARSLDGRLAVNAGFHAGHSTIRRVVMGDARARCGHDPNRSTRWSHCCTSRCAPARSVSRRRSARPTPTATARRCRHARAQPDEFLALAWRRARPRGHEPRVHPRAWARSPTSASRS